MFGIKLKIVFPWSFGSLIVRNSYEHGLLPPVLLFLFKFKNRPLLFTKLSLYNIHGLRFHNAVILSLLLLRTVLVL